MEVEPLNARELSEKITDIAEPVLTWLGRGGERIELSGPVARRWISKTDNFMASEFPFGGESFAIQLPAHWRTAFWLLVPWLRGMRLMPTELAADTDLVISNDLDFLSAVAEEGGPDVLVAQTDSSLALAWPGQLPALFLDGTADVMSYGDWVEDPYCASDGAVLVDEGRATFTGRLPIEDLRTGSLLRTLSPIDGGAALNGARVMVRTGDPVLFTAQLAQLWMAGARVVWAPDPDPRPGAVERERCDYVVQDTNPGLAQR